MVTIGSSIGKGELTLDQEPLSQGCRAMQESNTKGLGNKEQQPAELLFTTTTCAGYDDTYP